MKTADRLLQLVINDNYTQNGHEIDPGLRDEIEAYLKNPQETQHSTLSESKVMEVLKRYYPYDTELYLSNEAWEKYLSNFAKAICKLSVLDIAQVGEEEIRTSLEEAYKKAGPNAYFANGYKAGVNWLQSLNQKGEGWSTGMPIKTGDYIVMVKNGNVFKFRFDSDNPEVTKQYKWDLTTHWMPLPPNPEGGKG